MCSAQRKRYLRLERERLKSAGIPAELGAVGGTPNVIDF
ncbi:hypothetical protein SynRS9902_02142 [Synechococcus sp. RS9902]|nr:hypothetical protein SynRS9902_02142 [Synechococcus sp. RS9902]